MTEIKASNLSFILDSWPLLAPFETFEKQHSFVFQVAALAALIGLDKRERLPGEWEE